VRPASSPPETASIFTTRARCARRWDRCSACPPAPLASRKPVAILLGAEGAGLPEAVLSAIEERVTIPLAAGVESLSVGAAAAVILFEAARARR